MKFKKIGNKWIVRIDKGEEIIDTLKQFCKKNKIKLGSISGVGGTDRVTVGCFKAKTKEFYPQELTGDFEITNLTGNVSTLNNEVYLHLHISVADSKYNTYGGHLTSAIINGTAEIIIEEIKDTIEREFSEEIGLNLLFQENC